MEDYGLAEITTSSIKRAILAKSVSGLAVSGKCSAMEELHSEMPASMQKSIGLI